jgi:hypothetical protein
VCACIPCGRASPSSDFAGGTCGAARDACGAASPPGAGCYTTCAAACDCATGTCAPAYAPDGDPAVFFTTPGQVALGLGRIVTLHHRASTSYLVDKHIRNLYF